MSVQSIDLSDILLRQLLPSFKMIGGAIQACPKSLWAQRNIDPPLWQQVYHVLYGIDYWFSPSKDEFAQPSFSQNVNSVLGEKSEGFIDQAEMLDYLSFVEQKTERFVNALGGDGLMKPSPMYAKWTNLDVILEQLRHIQHHIGYLNRVLLKCKIKPVEWEMYDENGQED